MLAYVAGAGRAAAVADEASVKRRRRGTQLEMLMNLLPPQVRAKAYTSSLRPHILVASGQMLMNLLPPQVRAPVCMQFECVSRSSVYVGGVCM